MMNQLPIMVNVADIQRRYRTVADKVKKSDGPIIVLNNGVPDLVMFGVEQYHSFIHKMNTLEEDLRKIKNL